MGRVIDRLIRRMPASIDVTKQFFKAMWGKTDYTPQGTITQSSDYNCGAIANEFEYLRAFFKYLTRADDLSDYSAPYLDELAEFFVDLTRQFQESDASLVNRVYSLIRRNGNLSWMTIHCMVDVLAYYFNRDNIFPIEFDFDSENDDLIVNGTFEAALGAEWSIGGGATSFLSVSRAFTGSQALSWVGVGATSVTAAQNVTTVESTLYCYYFYIYLRTVNSDNLTNGKAYIKTRLYKSASGEYFNEDTGTWISGSGTQDRGIYVAVEQWVLVRGFFTGPTGGGTVQFLIKHLVGGDDAAQGWIDLVRLGPKNETPRFRMLLVSSGQSGEFMNLWPDGADPVGGTDEQYASFFESSYLGGESGGVPTQEAFAGVLEQIKPAGVLAVIETASRAVYTKFGGEPSLEDLRVAAWDFDGDLVDASGIGTTFDGSSGYSFTSGLYATQSLKYDSGSASLYTSNSSHLLESDVSQSLEVLVKIPASLPGGDRSIAMYHSTSSFYNVVVTSDGRWKIVHGGGSDQSSAGEVVGDGEYDLVMVYDHPNSEVRLYVDNVLKVTVTSATVGGEWILLGKDTGQADALTDAIIGRVSVYSRLLDSDERAALSANRGDI